MEDKNGKTKRTPHKWEAFSALILVILGVTLGTRFGIEIGTVLVLCSVYVIIIGFRCGYSWSELEQGIMEKIIDVIPVFFILLGIGFLISTWMFAGTIPTAIYYLVKVINPKFVVIFSFLVCAVVSTIIGTSWGTAGTIGVVMIGLAQVVGAPMPVVAAAIICGSHYGQLCSPMSDMVAITSRIAEVEPIDMVKRSMLVVIPSTVISLILYGFLGMNGVGAGGNAESVQLMLDGIRGIFNVNPIVLIPLAFIIFASVKKWPTAPSMFASGFIAIALGVIFNGFSIGDGLTAGFNGFDIAMTGMQSENVMPEIASLVSRGGMQTMSYTIILLFCAMFFTGTLSKIGCLDVIVKALFSNVNKIGPLYFASIITSFITAVTTLQAYLAVIVPSELLKDKYVDNGYAPINMAVAVQTVGAIIMPLFAWGDTGLYMSSVTGVPTMSFLPYAFFCWGTALVGLVMAFLGIGVKKIEK